MIESTNYEAAIVSLIVISVAILDKTDKISVCASC
jgi:hypothetical protein